MTEQQRQKVVTWALSVTQNTPKAPGAYELTLLDKYVRGVLTIDEVLTLLEASELEALRVRRHR